MPAGRSSFFAAGFRLDWLAVAAALLLAVCLHVFFFSRGFYSIGWDESGRTLDAYAWATHGGRTNDAWLPFYRICVGLGLRVFPDLFLTPRIISFLFGMAVIPAAAWLADELFQNRKTTLLTLALSTLLSQRIALSLAPLSDIMFIFVILVTMANFTRWLRTYNRKSLFLTALFGALASSIRFEGWIFGAVIFVVVFVVRLEWKDLLLFGAILFSFPLLWTVLSILFRINPAAAIVADARQYSQREILWRNPLVQFVLTDGRCLNLIGLAAILRFALYGPRRYRAILAACFAPLLVVSLFLLLMNSAQTGPSWRMIGVWSILTMPFTAYLLTGFSRAGKTKTVLAATIAVLVLGAFLYDAFRLERESAWAFPRADRLAGEYLNGLIAADANAKCLIDSANYSFLNIEIASQHPNAFLRNSVPEHRSVPILPIGGSVRAAVENRGVRFLAFKGTEYKDFLNRSPDVARLGDFGRWSIYKLTP